MKGAIYIRTIHIRCMMMTIGAQNSNKDSITIKVVIRLVRVATTEMKSSLHIYS